MRRPFWLQQRQLPKPKVPLPSQTEWIGLAVVTYNATSWKGLKEFLLCAASEVVLAQETHVKAEQVCGASAWAYRHGWKSFWQAAKQGAVAHTSKGGVAVFIRVHLGARPSSLQASLDRCGMVTQARVAAALVTCPGYPDIEMVSVYMQDSIPLSNVENAEILAAIGEALQLSQSMYIIGADFNSSPEDLHNTGFAAKLDGSIVFPDKGTCATAMGRFTTIDYFVMHKDLAAVVKSIRVLEDTPSRPHRPVEVDFHPKALEMVMWEFKEPQHLPRVRVIGPTWPLPPSKEVQGAVAAALAMAETGTIEQGILAIDNAYQLWADHAEVELSLATSTVIDIPKQRGQVPRLTKRSAIHKHKQEYNNPDTKALRWVLDRWRDVKENQQNEAHWEARHLTIANACMNKPKWWPVFAEAEMELEQIRQLINQLMDQERLAGMEIVHKFETDKLEGLRSKLAKQVSLQDIDNKKGWILWTELATSGSAGKGHWFTKPPQAWVPTVTLADKDGNIFADPFHLLEAEQQSWALIWGAWEAEDLNPLPGMAEKGKAMPKISPDMMREVSRRASSKTALGLGGFHLKHFELLSNESLEALAGIFQAAEVHSFMPTQIRRLLVPLLDKPTGGFRPIGIFCSAYRLWARCRRSVLQSWEGANRRPYFAAAAGKSPVDAVWKHAVRAQGATNSGMQAATLLWDLRKFYESFDHAELIKRGIATGLHEAMIRVCIRMYKSSRHIALKDTVGQALCPTRGIVAGCTAATTWVKVYTLAACDRLLQLCPCVHFDFYLDDFQASSTGPQAKVVNDIVQAARCMLEMVEVDFKGEVAMDKAGLVASNTATAKEIKAHLQEFAGMAITPVAKNLGIDYASGRPRGTWGSTTTRAARLARLRLRVSRLVQLKTSQRARTSRVFSAGLLPSANYGMQVTGLDNKQLAQLQRAAAASLPPKAMGASRTAKLVLHGDLSAPSGVAATLKWATETWRASSAAPGTAIFGLAEMARYWNQASHHWPKAWSQARGPIDVIYLELQRLQCKWLAPFEIDNRHGSKLLLTTASPTMVRAKLLEIHKELLEIKLQKGLQHNPAPWSGAPPMLDHIRAFLASSKPEKLDKAVVTCWAVGGFWTADRQQAAGYLVDSECPACKNGEDSLFHRLYQCKSLEAPRRAEMKSSALCAILEEGPKLSNTHGWMHQLPCYRPAPLFEAVFYQRSSQGLWERLFDASQWQLEGVVFSDGSCDPGLAPRYAKAAWALVQLDQEGSCCRRVHGPVPENLPQSAQAGEWMAAAVAAQLACKPLQLFGDCQAVISGIKKWMASGIWGAKQHDGFLRFIATQSLPAPFEAIHKVKAHRAVASATSEMDKRGIKANAEVDLLAKAALLLHPQLATATKLKNLEAWELATSITKFAGHSLQQFPRLAKAHERRTGPRAGPRPACHPKNPHIMVRLKEEVWHCSTCLCISWSKQGLHRRARQECTGHNKALRDTLQSRIGHTLLIMDVAGQTVAACSRCGYWMRRRIFGLGKPCLGKPSQAGQKVLKLVELGKSPDGTSLISVKWRLTSGGLLMLPN